MKTRTWYAVEARHPDGTITGEAGPFRSRAAARRELSTVAAHEFPDYHPVKSGPDALWLLPTPGVSAGNPRVYVTTVEGEFS